jgi:hypothetical protein
MPDHLNLILMGLDPTSDQLNGISFLRAQLKTALAPAKLQHQAYDHVLAEKERKRGAYAATCHYILENPVRADLVKNPQDWPYLGAIIPGYPQSDPLAPAFWPKFWKLYFETRDSRMPQTHAAASFHLVAAQA